MQLDIQTNGMPIRQGDVQHSQALRASIVCQIDLDHQGSTVRIVSP